MSNTGETSWFCSKSSKLTFSQRGGSLIIEKKTNKTKYIYQIINNMLKLKAENHDFTPNCYNQWRNKHLLTNLIKYNIRLNELQMYFVKNCLNWLQIRTK